MEEIMTPTLIAIFGSSIAITVSYIIAKKQITATVVSQNRQAWINTLRDCISEFQSAIPYIGLIDKKEWIKDLKSIQHDKLSSAIRCNNKIKLLINPKEDDHIELVELLTNVLNILLDTKEKEDETYDKINTLQADITVISQTILKREWIRVKKGK